MALKDLKSILSDFRIPKKTPLANRDTGTINKGGNQTPLGGMLESTPKVAIAKTTPNKNGADTTPIKQGDKFKGETNPTPMDNSTKFLGETNPTPMDNSTKFLGETNTKPMSLEERYLGETNPTKSDTSEKFLGETNPTKPDTSEKFLGETTPAPSDNSSNFLGETTPNPADNTSQFLGETTPNPANNTSQFLGETTPNPADNSSHFLGETTPNPADNTSQFLGETTPTPANNSSNFLGETTPTPANNSSNFLGETTPNPANNSSNFLGETTPNTFGSSPNFLGETTPSSVNYFSDIHSTGFTSPFGGVDASKYVGVNPDNTVFNGSTSLFGELGSTNFFPDGLTAAGFTPNLFHRAPSKFFGVGQNGEHWISSISKFSNYKLPDEALSFSTGYKEFKSKTKSGNVQQYTPDSTNYEASYKSIGTTMEQRNSPSFLDLMYAKYNLREDAYNTGLTLFRHPLILRGIQRKGIKKGEPQNWGIGGVTFDDGMIRGGVITSTVRALVDVARIGAWMLSVKGLLWGIRQAGMQSSQKYGKVWTPVGLLAAVGGQHVGLHAQRPGLIPLVDDTFQYENSFATRILLGDYKDKLQNMYEGDLGILKKFTGITQRFPSEEHPGGFNSLYGIGWGGTRRYVNTFDGPGQRYANEKALLKTQTLVSKYQKPINPYTFEKDKTYTEVAAKAIEEGIKDEEKLKFFGVATHISESNNPTGGVEKGNNYQDKKEVIQDYQTIAYGKIPDRGTGNGRTIDFRDLLFDDVTDNNTRGNNENYSKYKIENRVHFPSPGLVKQDEDRYTWHNVDKTFAGNESRWDKIQASDIDDIYDNGNDLVHLWFTDIDGGSKIQFRGAVKGITDTFTPSWSGYKYNGRADKAWQYNSFDRNLGFNIQVYATSRVEMKPIYAKLGRLASMTMPTYGTADSGSAGYQGSIIKFRLGSLFNNELAYIDALSYTMSDNVPWDISLLGSTDFIGELPMGVDVSITLKILGKAQPEYGKPVYNGY